MANHVRTQIRDAVVADLLHHPPYGSNVFPARTWPLEDGLHFPAVIVWTEGGAAAFDALADDDADVTREHDELMMVEGRARHGGGDDGDLDRELDDIEVTVQHILMRSAVLAALVDRRELIRVEKKSAIAGDAREGLIRLTYRIAYTTLAGDPTTRV